MDVYENLKKAGIELPEKLAAAGLYKPVNQAGNLLFVSGQGSMDKGVHLTGRVGARRRRAPRLPSSHAWFQKFPV